MAFHTVLTPPPDIGKSAADQHEDTVFLKDGFILSAFIFTGLWLLSKRLWLAFAIFLPIWLGIILGGRVLGIHPLGIVAAQALLGLYLALEGHGLLERKLLKQGWTLAGVVEGKDLDLVQRRYFEQADVKTETRPAMLPASSGPPRMMVPTPVLGLFPDAAGRT